MRVLVTGGLGFIGSALIRSLGRHEVSSVDANTYAADKRRLEDADVDTIALDIRSPELSDLMKRKRPDVVVHLAAETHVTRSEDAEEHFFDVNARGTEAVLKAAEEASVPLLLHISTDEVYGPFTGEIATESSKLPGEGLATSAYARSKALADDLMLSSSVVPTIVLRPTNCFGPWQHPEKAVPRWITRALSARSLPVWGDGLYTRDWLHVDDAVAGIKLLIESGEPGKAYNIAPEHRPIPNVEVAAAVAEICGSTREAIRLTSYDRPQHDRGYRVDASRIRALGWRPRLTLRDGLQQTAHWYEENRSWWLPLLAQADQLYADLRNE